MLNLRQSRQYFVAQQNSEIITPSLGSAGKATGTQEIDACFRKKEFVTVLNLRQSHQYFVAQQNSEIITPSLGFPILEELIQMYRNATVMSIADAIKVPNGIRLSVTGILTSVRQAPSGLLCSAALKDEVTEAEMKLKLWGDKMAILTEDFPHTTVSIQNLSVAQYKDQKELTSTPSTDRLLQKQENRSEVVQAINNDEIVISNGVYDIQGYQPENITLGDEVEYTVQEKKIITIDCFKLLLARHLADVSCFIGPPMPSGICMEIHTEIVQERKNKQSREGIPRQPHVYL